MTIDAVRAGKDVYVEKPISHSIDDGDRRRCYQPLPSASAPTQIRSSPNWARYAINGVLIGIGVSKPALRGKATEHGEDLEQSIIDLKETYQNLTARNALESFHDAQQASDIALNLFNGGYLPLGQRVDFEESGRLLRFYEDGLHGSTYLED